jgi:hypothetical protein
MNLVGASKFMVSALRKNNDNGISSCIQALGFVFHKVVEIPVDNFVDNLCECPFGVILHQIA